MFRSFDTGDSLLRIVNTLNEEGITTISGKQWRPPTVFHILRNETYTGRTVYRRTQAVKIRDPRSGRSRRRVVERDESEWTMSPMQRRRSSTRSCSSGFRLGSTIPSDDARD